MLPFIHFLRKLISNWIHLVNECLDTDFETVSYSSAVLYLLTLNRKQKAESLGETLLLALKYRLLHHISVLKVFWKKMPKLVTDSVVFQSVKRQYNQSPPERF